MKCCDKCNKECVLAPNMFFLDGVYFSGWVCWPCNALYENKYDSMFDYEKHQRSLKDMDNENIIIDPEKAVYSEMIFTIGNLPWLMKLRREAGRQTILFNREDYPDFCPDDFAKAVVEILDEVRDEVS